MESNNNEQGQSPSTRAAHHRGQNTSVAPAKPASPTRSTGVPAVTSRATIASFFVRPQTTPCCTCASSSDSSARGASHGNACHASRSSESCAGHSVCGPGTTHRSSSPGTSFCDPLLSSPLLAAWKRQKVPIVASCGITPLVVTPLRHWGYARCAKYFPSYC